MTELKNIFKPNGDGNIGGGSGSMTEPSGEENCKTPEPPTLDPGI